MTNMIKLVFASGNIHKLSEIKAIIDPSINLLSMREVGFEGDIDEYGTTLDQNAQIKSDLIHDTFGLNCFSDDTGLEIESLNGEPGVYSARYAGTNCSFNDNMDLVLKNLEGKRNRNARFRTVINLWWNETNYVFEGSVDGQIEHEKKGNGGFGYDPIFKPKGSAKTFAEMTQLVKSELSHRARATKKMVDFLNSQMNS